MTRYCPILRDGRACGATGRELDADYVDGGYVYRVFRCTACRNHFFALLRPATPEERDRRGWTDEAWH